MNKEQLTYILKQNESLKMQIERLNQSTERLQTRYYDAENQLNSFKNKYDFLNKQFKEVARQAFPREFIEEGVSKGSEKDVYDFILNKIKELETGLFSMTTEHKKVLADLKENVEALEKYKNATASISAPIQSEDGEEQDPTMTPLGLATPMPVEDEESMILKLMGSIEDREWQCIKCVGVEKTLFTDIVTETKLPNTTLSELLKGLTNKGILTFEKITKGGKGRPAHHYFLTPIGSQLYKLKFEEAPTVSKLEELSTHGSANHGGLMLEVGTFLHDNGCEVLYDGPETTFKLKSGREIRFDIKAYDIESKQNLFIETERGKCGEAHLTEKFDKCLEFTELGLSKEIYFIAPEKSSLNVIQQRLFKWIGQNKRLQILNVKDKNRAVLVFKTCTLSDFKAGEIRDFYYGLK